MPRASASSHSETITVQNAGGAGGLQDNEHGEGHSDLAPFDSAEGGAPRSSPQTSASAAMKITAIETILLKIPYDNGGPPWNMSGTPWSTLDTLIVPICIGRDPTAIGPLMRELRQKLHIFGWNGSVLYGISGIDIALWDIAGKLAGLPLHRLLGGAARDELGAYASLMRYTDPAIVARNAARAVERGYRWVKLHEIDIPQVKAAREAIGRDIKLMVDTNCPWSVGEALEMARRFAPFDLHWLEEPIFPPDDHAGLAALRAAGTPIAAGENASGL